MNCLKCKSGMKHLNDLIEDGKSVSSIYWCPNCGCVNADGVFLSPANRWEDYLLSEDDYQTLTIGEFLK